MTFMSDRYSTSHVTLGGLTTRIHRRAIGDSVYLFTMVINRESRIINVVRSSDKGGLCLVHEICYTRHTTRIAPYDHPSGKHWFRVTCTCGCPPFEYPDAGRAMEILNAHKKFHRSNGE